MFEGPLAKCYEFPRARRPGVRVRVVNYYINCKVGPAYFLPQHESRCFPEPGGVRVPRRPPKPATSPWGNVEFAEKHHAQTQLLAKAALNLQVPHGETSNSHKNMARRCDFWQKQCSAPRNPVIREGGSSAVSQKRCPRRSQPAAHTHSGTVSVRVPHLPSATPILQSSHLGASLVDARMLSCCVYLPPASPPFAAIRHSHGQS